MPRHTVTPAELRAEARKLGFQFAPQLQAFEDCADPGRLPVPALTFQNGRLNAPDTLATLRALRAARQNAAQLAQALQARAGAPLSA